MIIMKIGAILVTIEEKYNLYQRIVKYLDRPDIQKKVADIFIEQLLYSIPNIKDIELGEKHEFKANS